MKRKDYPTRRIGLRKWVKPITKVRARQMRKHPTPAEAHLWKYLKNKKLLGLTFQRQAIIRGWIVDFWCSKRGLVVEVDGSSHRHRVKEDKFRDGVMTSLGITVLRVPNSDVLHHIRKVLRKIRIAADIS